MEIEEIIETLDKLMLRTINHNKVKTSEQIDGYLECIRDAKKAFLEIEANN